MSRIDLLPLFILPLGLVNLLTWVMSKRGAS